MGRAKVNMSLGGRHRRRTVSWSTQRHCNRQSCFTSGREVKTLHRHRVMLVLATNCKWMN